MIAGHPIRWYDPSTWPWMVHVWLLLLFAGWIKPAWRWFRNQLAQNWPEAQGHIDSINVEAKNGFSKSEREPSYRAKLFYSYGAGGQTYHGKWQKECDTEEEAEEFVRDLEGKPITVVYSPRKPSRSTLLEDAVIALANTRAPRPDAETGQQSPELPLWLRPIVWALMVVAAAGLGLSLWVHFAALGGHKVGSDTLFTGLHLGIFVVFLPAVLIAGHRTGNAHRKTAWKLIVKNLPLWMKIPVYLFSGYATINFLIFFSEVQNSGGGGTSPVVWRGFSGHWMAFYSWALAVLYSTVHTPNESDVARQHQKVS